MQQTHGVFDEFVHYMVLIPSNANFADYRLQ